MQQYTQDMILQTLHEDTFGINFWEGLKKKVDLSSFVQLDKFRRGSESIRMLANTQKFFVITFIRQRCDSLINLAMSCHNTLGLSPVPPWSHGPQLIGQQVHKVSSRQNHYFLLCSGSRQNNNLQTNLIFSPYIFKILHFNSYLK